MKRHRPEEFGRRVRPPGWSYSHPEQSNSDEDDFPTPPARKILKSLLENEIDRAIRDLDQDTASLGRIKNHRAASLIPEFDPEGEDCTVAAWLKKIDQLGDIHNWNDKIKAFHLQDKLRGQARKWYNRLEEYDYSWDEWKQMLLRAFPKHRDYSALLDEMMQRRKLPNETMTKYYQDKVSMCFRCKLSDSASVSCIIRGLPSSLQPNARAFQCERPDELYEAFLCALEDNDVCTAPRHFEFEGVSYSLPATLLRGGEGHIKVVNTGNQDVVWKAGQTLTRAESCEEP